MTFSTSFATALLDWDDRLFKLHQARWQAQNIIPTLRDMNMNICAKNAQKIYQDIDLQLRTGELLIRMRTKFLEAHTLSAVEMEQWRQFTSVAMVFYAMTEDEARGEYGQKTIASHEAYTTAAKTALVTAAQLDLVAERIVDQYVEQADTPYHGGLVSEDPTTRSMV